MAVIEVGCFSCGKMLQYSDSPGFRESCPHCHADVHSCKNCLFYDSKVYNECREPAAEVVREKERANFCEFYQVRTGSVDAQNKKAADLKAAAEALFKKKS